MEISFNSVVPILRIFDIAKADEFYQGFLGFRSIGITASIQVLHSTVKSRAAI
jgi:hypothetical protein